MPLLFPAFPAEVGAIGAAAPVTAMSRKSTVPDPAPRAATLSVLWVPMVLDAKKVLHASLAPAEIVSVPLIVWLAVMLIALMFVDVALPVIDKLLYVFAPPIVNVVIALLVSETLLNVSPGVVSDPVVELSDIVDVPALKVNPVADEIVNAPVKESELAPKLSARVCVELFEYEPNEVIVNPLVLNVPDACVMVPQVNAACKSHVAVDAPLPKKTWFELNVLPFGLNTQLPLVA